MRKLPLALLFLAAALGPAACGGEQGPAAPAAATPSPLPPPAGPVRPPAAAEMGFYPAGEAACRAAVAECLEGAGGVQPQPALRALVSPHAGYRYSGPVAAAGYRLLAPGQFDRVIILAPSHHADFAGASVPEFSAYRTPLGEVPLDPRTAELRDGRLIRSRPGAHAEEHSLEVQLPFLQAALGEFSLVPVVIGPRTSEAELAVIAAAVERQLDERTLLVASTDLSHYLADAEARALDEETVALIAAGDARRVLERGRACGAQPLCLLLQIAARRGWAGQVLDRRNSFEVTGTRADRVVGYVSVAFLAEGSATMTEQAGAGEVTAEEQAFLLDLARQTIQRRLAGAGEPELDPGALSARLTAKRGCFVTLKTKAGDRLRGCIGHIFAREALYLSVIHNALNAAFSDPRFDPVRAGELEGLTIEVSVLTAPRELAYESPADLLDKLVPGRDGVYLTFRGRGASATYLPQVWAQLPDKVEFLSELSRKAGMARDAWRTESPLVEIYHAQAFHETE